MIYGSVCSGIESATVAWHPLGWRPQFFAEIEPFPSAVLAHHYPEVPNLGDITKFNRWNDAAIDVLVGGTPCQSFSVAGLRAGLDDPRGNLMLTYLAIAERYRPTWVVWENVPGVLSSGGGRDFGVFLRALGELGYGWAYRVLDAQYFNLAQRRARVFVVGCLGGWSSAAAVLFERASLSGNPPPRRVAKEKVAGTITRSAIAGGSASGGDGRENMMVPCVTGTITAGLGNYKMGAPEIDANLYIVAARSLRAEGYSARPPAIALANAILTPNGGRGGIGVGAIATRYAVRRLTPRECERLQGFPDDYTLIPYRGKPAKDGPRYKALGNSKAVPVVRWIGQRIEVVQSILKSKAA